jgi:hypothetical protein
MSYVSLNLKNNQIDFIVFYQVYCALFFEENYDEILPAHYTWRVPEKGFKINCIMC